ncbi:MAG: hypothetical protein HYX28_09070 [Candidatus Koribacter versatilis]|uniref:Uncharacterized protein n=1 Tax=Candidatus Korobacter versatilis TaxID=658062 RepID=A0A932A926_9BACT|nr:hypothetical protein [Candidatus Koribacter versatilis]
MTATKTPAKTAAAKPFTTKAKGKNGKHQAQAEQPVQAPPPPKPEQLPPTRPTVTFNHGKLSILANNSTMADVLNSVRAQTGAQFEMGGVSSADRVYAKLGPGAPKDILAALLDGSRFNFAIVGSPTDPALVARVVLMPKAGAPSATETTVASNPVPRPMVQRPDPDEQSDEEGPPEDAPAEEIQQAQPEQQQPQQEQQQPGQVKTPEQLLQELQQMQQQQQQQNPNAQPQNPQPIPDREIPDDQNRNN